MKQTARFLLATVIAAGSCPAQGLNPLSITTPSPNVQNLTWIAGEQRPFWLETSFNLEEWSDLSATPTIGTGGSVTVTDNSTTPKKFYRLREGAVRPGFDDFFLDRNDDGSTPQIPIGFTISLFGKNETQCWVNNNGNITFDGPRSTYTPLPLRNLGFSLIAPFWADVDTNAGGSDVVTYSYGVESLNGRLAFGVNWVNVGYFSNHDDKLNSFQLVLVTRPDTGINNFDIEFNYNKILWETGDASGGSNGLGGAPARCGLSNGTTQTIELAYSAQTLIQLDKNPNTGLSNFITGLIYRSRNSGIPGRFVFQVRSGQVLGALDVNAGRDQSLPQNVFTAQLAGSVTDPSGGSFTVEWSVFDGPMGVTFSNASILNPIVTIPTGETAVLQLRATSVTDPNITATDTITIN
jgi:Nidogen-like